MATMNRMDQRNGTEESGSAQDQAKAIASLPPNLAILKMENDSIQSLAAAHPRDMAKIKQDLGEILEAFPVLAEEAIYSKPVGKVVDAKCNGCNRTFELPWKKNGGYVCPRCGEEKVQSLTRPRQKFARGLSIRAAETLRETYGFTRVRADIVKLDDATVKIEATFVDYQRGNMTQLPIIVSRMFKNWRGQMEMMDESRFYESTVKGAVSKAIREAVVRSVNPGMRLWFEAECERIQSSLLDDSKIDTMIQEFGKLKVTPEQVEELIGKPRANGWTDEDRKRLVGIYTGLKSGEVTVEELFADEPAGDKPKTETPKDPQKPNGPVTGSSLSGGKATTGKAAGGSKKQLLPTLDNEELVKAIDNAATQDQLQEICGGELQRSIEESK